MSCLSCNKSPAEYRFRVLEVHTLHVRDFGGERIIQALGEEREFSVCAACVSSEMQAVLYPAGRILRKCSGFVVLILAGLGLTLAVSLREVMTALRAIGPLAVFVGVSGTIGKVREVLTRRKFLLGREDAERLSAWECVLRNAPKKYHDNDITYIPAEDVVGLKPEDLAAKYELLPAIARRAKEQGI